MRTDLLALTPDDLATLSNRGTVKRVQRELQENLITVSEFSEAPDGTVTAVWSEGITCTLPPNTPLGECSCTCPAVGVCRHLVQTVLFYGTWAKSDEENPVVAAPTVWNPGEITDEALSKVYRKLELTKLRKEFDEPHVIELVRGVKPLARFHTLPIVVRFLTPGDLHYAICTCAEPAPCSHIPLAIWAFRLLPEESVSGLVTTGHHHFAVPTDALNDVSIGLSDLLELGISGASPASIRLLRDSIRRCQDEGLVWPGEILSELLEEVDRYTKQDSRFSAAYVAELIGEWVIRVRAIRNPSEAVPQIFVRGSAQDHTTAVSAIRLTGLGCGVITRRGVTRLSAYLVDADTGGILAIQRETSDPKPGDPKPVQLYSELARATVLRDSSLASIGSRQMFVKGGKRTADGLFVTGRAAASVTPSTFAWESLPATLLADSFAESRARRAAQPPSCLRPRRVGEDLAVYAIHSVESAVFDVFAQAVIATVRDFSGDTAMLVHPFTSRGSEGAEKLARWLQQRPEALRFVAGRARRNVDSLQILPIALIFDYDGARHMLQPWVDRADDDLTATDKAANAPTPSNTDPLVGYLEHITMLLGELFLTGLRRVDERTAQQWQQLVHQGYALGFVRLMEPLAALHELLTQRQHDLAWDWRALVPMALQVAALCRFAAESA